MRQLKRRQFEFSEVFGSFPHDYGERGHGAEEKLNMVNNNYVPHIPEQEVRVLAFFDLET